MKTNFTRTFSALILAGSVLAAQSSFAQDTIFVETMGVTVSGTTAISAHTFDNTGVGSITYSGTGDVRVTSGSSTSMYPTASGGSNVMINATDENFFIQNIDIEDVSDIEISFGLRKGSNAEDGSNFNLEVYVDGSLVHTYTPTLPTGSGTSTFHYVSTSITQTGSLLSLKFIRIDGSGTSPEFRIDDIMVTATPDPLSVNLLDFAVKSENNTRFFNWSTAQEKELSHFELEASSNGKDFQVIYSKPAVNSWEGATYSYTSVANDNNTFFRLKSIDFDGTYSYSKVVMLTQQAQDRFTVSNNFTRNLVIVNAPKASAYKVFNIAGQVVLEGEFTTGTNTLDLGQLANGQYILNVQGESFKLIKN